MPRPKKPIFHLLACLAACLLASAASAEQERPYLNIDDPDYRAYPVAVPDFKDLGSGTGAAEVREGSEILRNDLALTSSFKVLDPRSYLADVRLEGIAGSAINFSDWINIGAEGLIKVGLLKSGTKLTLDCHLFEVATGRELLQKKYTGTEKDLRRMVHRWADAVVRHFTSTRSVFDTRIAFTKRVGRNKAICVMDFDGYGEQCVVKNGSINLLPAWNASGTGLYYTTYLKGGPHQYFLDLKTGKSRVISAFPGQNTGAAAAPNGKVIAVSLSKDENAEVYIMSPSGKHPVRLTRNWAIDMSPSFSPDGKRIAFVSERSGNPQIYTMNADGSDQRRLTFRGNYNQTPDWSPRGDWILFNARDERLGYDIFRINPGTGEIRRLTQDQGNNQHPSYSPDGNLVVFSSNRSGEEKLYISNADGSNQRLISRGKGEYTTPAWSPWPAEKK